MPCRMNPALQHEGANQVDDAPVRCDTSRLRTPMQRLQIQLLGGLGRDEPHRRALHGLGNRFGIIEVVLLSLAVGRTYLAGINLAS